MQNAIQRGDVVDLVAPYAVTSGAGVLVGSIFGLATSAAASGATVPAQLVGVHYITALATDAFTQGAAVYWDNTNKRCTITASGNTKIGVATVASTAATVAVRLNGAF